MPLPTTTSTPPLPPPNIHTGFALRRWDSEWADVTIEEQSGRHGDQDGHHRDPEQRQEDLPNWSLVTGSGGGGAVGEKKSENNKFSLMHTNSPPTPPNNNKLPSTVKALSKQTAHEPLCFFRRAPTWSVAQTHTHAWRAQIVVTDAGVAVKYYLAQSFKGETIKREG